MGTEGDRVIGSTIAKRYRVDAVLGIGGQATVYRAVDQRTGTAVALKLLAADRAGHSVTAQRFRREAATGKRVQHPNICAILDDGDLADGSLYLVMELLDGRPLTALIAEGIDTPRILAILRQVLEALAEAHRIGVAHRDVKPDNIMILDGDRAKLLDFGMASNDRAAAKLTGVGIAVGTPEYVSPEMALGLQVDGRADLYSVGVVLFEAVTKRLPFERADLRSLLRAHVKEDAPRATAVAPQAAIPPALDELIARALAKAPEERFQTASEMIAAIDDLASAPALPAPPPTVRKRAVRSRAWLALPLVLFGAAGAAVVHGRATEDSAPVAVAPQAALVETAPTCAERKRALARLAPWRDPTLLPSLLRARDRGAENACMQRELRAAIRALQQVDGARR